MKNILCTVLLSCATLAAAAEPGPGTTTARRLAGNCANCHGTGGLSGGTMPDLAGLAAAYFVDQMRRFRDGTRAATVMHQLAKGYSDEEIAQLAAHFAQQKPR
jgi:cytochrome subunit of sulfide dehydrogenase